MRFVDTGAIAAKGDDTVGIELGGVFKALHFASEAQWVKVSGYRPGTVFSQLDTVAGGAFYAREPSFFAGYAEVGYFPTDESRGYRTRGYRSGRWDRAKVDSPIGSGGWGAWQLVGRYSYLDLADRVGRAAAGAMLPVNFLAPNYVPGGKQQGLLVGINWQPIDYVRVMAQYGRVGIAGGPLAAAVNQVAVDTAAQGANYELDSFAMRAQLDF